MGTSSSSPSLSLLEQLIPLDESESLNEVLAIGRFQIYRFRVEPYEMVMRHTRQFTADHQSYRDYQELVQMGLHKLEHKNIAKIHQVSLCKSRVRSM